MSIVSISFRLRLFANVCDVRFFAAHSYDQVTNFLQGYVDNELNLNTDDSCTKNCVDYTKTKNYLCAPETVCGETPVGQRPLSVCKGDVRDCVDLGDIDTNVCHSAEPTRRYNFLQYSNGHSIGLEQTPDWRCELVSKVSDRNHNNHSIMWDSFISVLRIPRRKHGAAGS